MLAMAMLPTLSHALAAARGESAWVQVCTPQGMRLVAVSAAQLDAAEEPVQTSSAAGHLEHCPCCTHTEHSPGLPPAAAPGLPLPLHGAALPALFLHAPYTLHAWRSAQPRGPPALG